MEHYATMKKDGDHLSLLTWEDLSNLISVAGWGGKQVTKHKQYDLISLKQATMWVWVPSRDVQQGGT